MQELTQLYYNCFSPAIRLALMGCSTPLKPNELQRLTDLMIQTMSESPHDIWIGIKDSQTGRFIAASNWKVHLEGSNAKRQAVEAPPWLEGEGYKSAERLMGVLHDMRQKPMSGPLIHLNICFTDANYRRRGAGGMMLQWGCDLADQLFIPGYIEATTDGNFLYNTFGFYELESIDSGIGEEGVTMRRDARSQPILGGRAAVLK
ncbi:hypothetical protein LTR91_013028 [Friedmanniomyces endolithicus]|uniref:N-acetyltransferase domain-containing protein n=1 Tax=Friedmanniomyces endolithicus TaxID=329885 RepID=A0AAN6QPN4_9PEZI|nr:hypothetical protein LTR94_000639 [Friedmanniomyces endolithicus]KAK0790821.1 hypothetical protein LTR59_009131 [Friedmanniomyces endolithicus]KAK0798512.1 hypothetical protein LTR38_007819 [Friedmanniomyces endolithicus]KAK0803723.1 hypothetical protein LTR75_007880 [Friedmanniomyces endolithicus]KAK0856831.1 hypothetical protein LTR03_001168 [Friedmanniomyces endolithicus]